MGISVRYSLPNGHVLGGIYAQVGQRACPCWATCLPMLGTLLAQKCIVFGLKDTGLLTKRYVVAISKKHGYYPKKNMFATQKKPFTTQRNILTTQKDKTSVGFSWDMLHSGETGRVCFCFCRIICRFIAVCDTSMILLWYFIVIFSEKYHLPKMLCTKCINGKLTAKMILWCFFGDF